MKALSTRIMAEVAALPEAAPIYAKALANHKHRWLLAFAASTITHPIIFLALPHLINAGTFTYLLIAESFAVLVEAWWLRKWSPTPLKPVDALLWSLVANASSVALGSILRILGWF